jgi:hypothetical protein
MLPVDILLLAGLPVRLPSEYEIPEREEAIASDVVKSQRLESE